MEQKIDTLLVLVGTIQADVAQTNENIKSLTTMQESNKQKLNELHEKIQQQQSIICSMKRKLKRRNIILIVLQGTESSEYSTINNNRTIQY